jgi:hypothetical protein
MQSQYQIEKMKKENAELEKAALKAQGTLAQVTEKVVQSNVEKKRLMNEEEIQEMQKSVMASQQTINQILGTHNTPLPE